MGTCQPICQELKGKILTKVCFSSNFVLGKIDVLDQILDHVNKNMEDIITPVKVEELEKLLTEVNYD